MPSLRTAALATASARMGATACASGAAWLTSPGAARSTCAEQNSGPPWGRAGTMRGLRVMEDKEGCFHLMAPAKAAPA